MVRKAADIILAVDISQSMMTEDIAPNRMELAKRFGQQLLESLQGERIGLIVFAAGAYTQVPLTTDYGALQLFLESASPDLAPYQGTAIGAAIDLAGRLFDANSANHKALIVLTDGETHDKDAVEKARVAKEKRSAYVYHRRRHGRRRLRAGARQWPKDHQKRPRGQPGPVEGQCGHASPVG